MTDERRKQLREKALEIQKKSRGAEVGVLAGIIEELLAAPVIQVGTRIRLKVPGVRRERSMFGLIFGGD